MATTIQHLEAAEQCLVAAVSTCHPSNAARINLVLLQLQALLEDI